MPIQKKIDVNVGFDSSVKADAKTLGIVKAQIDVLKDDLKHCCNTHSTVCNTEVKTNFDWDRNNKPAPSDGDYNLGIPSDVSQLSQNTKNISGKQGGVNALITNTAVTEPLAGVSSARGFAFPTGEGIVVNATEVADGKLQDTVAHELGHHGGKQHTPGVNPDPHNRMTDGTNRDRDIFAPYPQPDQQTCQAYQKLSH